MKSSLLFIYLASIFFSAAMAFFYRRAIRSRQLSILIPYLILVLIQEIVVYLYLRRFPSAPTAIVYNIYKPVNVLVFFWIYYGIPFMKPLRKPMLWLTLAYLTITLVNYCFVESIFTPSSYLSLARGFIITFYGILFLSLFFTLITQRRKNIGALWYGSLLALLFFIL